MPSASRAVKAHANPSKSFCRSLRWKEVPFHTGQFPQVTGSVWRDVSTGLPDERQQVRQQDCDTSLSSKSAGSPTVKQTDGVAFRSGPRGVLGLLGYWFTPARTQSGHWGTGLHDLSTQDNGALGAGRHSCCSGWLLVLSGHCCALCLPTPCQGCGRAQDVALF